MVLEPPSPNNVVERIGLSVGPRGSAERLMEVVLPSRRTKTASRAHKSLNGGIVIGKLVG